MSKRVYKKQSKIPNCGTGLFAGEDIKKGTLITEFIGKLMNANETTSGWSNIYFSDDKCIQCSKSNLASYANDCIKFPKKKRNLVNIIEREEPLYTCYEDTKTNSVIYQNNELHRAWLRATRNIKKGEEIFTHYGLPFWMRTESGMRDYEPELEKYGGAFPVPENIFRTKSFEKYVEMFYDDVDSVDVQKMGKKDVVMITTDNGFKESIMFTIDMLIGNNYKEQKVEKM